jgi:hypothetical protein
MGFQATKVYFMDPILYGNAKNGLTLTFSTGSGLPDPLEWNGADWYMRQYSISEREMENHGLKSDKNPLIYVMFS